MNDCKMQNGIRGRFYLVSRESCIAACHLSIGGAKYIKLFWTHDSRRTCTGDKDSATHVKKSEDN